MKAMKIGEVSRLSGVGIETIRYYEKERLLREPERRPSGYRQYDGSTIERLDYIRRAKELGFTLAEIRELLELSFARQGCHVDICQRAEAKIADIEQKIRNLNAMKRSLGKIVRHCQTKRNDGSCPLVHKLSARPLD